MKSYLIVLTSTLYFLLGANALASPNPKFEQPGEWIKVADLEQVLEASPDSEALLVILDQQTQLEQGLVSSYLDIAIRIESAKTMSSMMSLFSPAWHPDHGDLIVHRYQIVRGSEIIDLTANEEIFDVIRREENLERQMINGTLTAISQVENLQLDDIVRMSFTFTKRNEALADRVQSIGGFVAENVNVDFTRQMVRWPDTMPVSWRGSKEEIVPVKSSAEGWTELRFDYRSKELDVEIPENAPVRFRDQNYFEVASFTSWKDVSRVNAALYPKSDGIVPGGALDLEIKAIASQTSDKMERMALALRLVQGEVRYLFNGLGFGNYTPQTPEETWRLRYGDCKAKTYLLLAALRRLGIKSVPMLVSTSQRDAVKDRLPSFQAFDHIIVKAELDGKTYWLDGTQTRTRLADIGDSPAHRFGLPSIKSGAELEEIVIRRPGRPLQLAEVTYDLTAGTELPALFDLQVTLRDSDALKIKQATTQLSAEKAKELREEIALDYVLEGIITETSFIYDDELETGNLSAKGLSYLDWDTKLDRRRHQVWSTAGTFEVQESRDEEELRDIPVQLSYPRYFKYHVTYNLPERYGASELSGQIDVSDELGGFQFDRSVHKVGNQVISSEEYYTSRWELPASEFELERQKLALLNRKKVEIILPLDAPTAWRDVEAFRASADMKKHRAAFNQHVANAKEDDTGALANRAYFFVKIGEYENAIADIQAALAIDSNAENYRWLGNLQLGLDTSAAKASYAKAIEIRPAYFDALLKLIRLHVRLEEYDEANLVLANAKSDGLLDNDAESLQIEILQAEGKFDEALQIMNALVDEEPDSASYLSDRCLLRAMEKKDLDLALDDCTNMIELAKRSAYYHFMRGLVYYRKGDYQLAISDLDKAIKTDDSAGYIYNLRAATYGKLGNTAMSEEDLKAAKFHDENAGWYWDHFID